MKVSYFWLKRYIYDIPDAEKIAQAFERHLCEVEGAEKRADGDVILDLNILPNRAHDLLSHQGIAKELAGMLGLSFKDPNEYIIPESKETQLTIQIETNACRRYVGRIVRGVKIGPSPEWMRASLEAIGQKSINNIVDATNLVMFDCGNPTHAFDLNKLTGGKIVVTSATDGEQLETVGGEKIVASLKSSDMIISDGTKTLAIAGVKGGTNSGISDDTTDVVLEVANFDPISVRKTARRLGLLSDSAKRFENDLSPELAGEAMKKLTSLVAKVCPKATFEDMVDIYPAPQEKRILAFSLARINKKLGANIQADELEAILKNYGFAYTKNNDEYVLEVPPLRLDLVGEHDIAEEIGRIYGYEKITPVIPTLAFSAQHDATYTRTQIARERLLADGYSEVMTYTFTKKGKVEVARGLKGKEFLRTNLSIGLMEAYDMNRLNAPLLGVQAVKIFEIGSIFPEKGAEDIHVAYADTRGVVEATLEEFTRDMIRLKEEIHEVKGTQFKPWSQYPFIVRDIAVWLPEGTNPEELVSLCVTEGGALLAHTPYIFDTFTKDNRTSFAVRLVFQSYEKTLTEDEVTPIIEKIYSTLQSKGFDVR